MHSVLHVLLLLFCVLPALPLMTGWIETVRNIAKFGFLRVVLLLLVSASFTWIVLALIYPATLGPFYSRTRYAIIEWNFVLMVLTAIAAYIRKPRGDWATVLSAVTTGLVWAYLGVINSIA